jgi:hypothetical protein
VLICVVLLVIHLVVIVLVLRVGRRRIVTIDIYIYRINSAWNSTD